MPKRLLFVDDEPLVLQGLKRSLHSLQGEWSMEFASSGSEALEIMGRTRIDVVVSDMRMPGMDGAQLLQIVKSRHPQVIRIILSGQSSRASVLRSITPTHQYLSKPCEPEELKAKLARAFALRDLLENPTVKAVVSQLKSIPSLPALYDEMLHELQSEEPSVAKLGAIVGKDVGMTAKILQFANSALIGLRCNVSNPVQAVCFLGLDMVRALVMSVHVFSQFENDQLQRFGVNELWEHSFLTGVLAQTIAQAEKMPQHVQDDSFTGGLLHDVGKLILVTTMTPMYQTIIDKVSENQMSLVDAEREYLGCSHGEVGAYLIGIWGLPHTIVEAVAWHHVPSAVTEPGFSALTAVHVANSLAPLVGAPLLPAKRIVDQEYLRAIGLGDHLPLWQEACEKRLLQISQRGNA